MGTITTRSEKSRSGGWKRRQISSVFTVSIVRSSMSFGGRCDVRRFFSLTELARFHAEPDLFVGFHECQDDALNLRVHGRIIRWSHPAFVLEVGDLDQA